MAPPCLRHYLHLISLDNGHIADVHEDASLFQNLRRHLLTTDPVARHVCSHLDIFRLGDGQVAGVCRLELLLQPSLGTSTALQTGAEGRGKELSLGTTHM